MKNKISLFAVLAFALLIAFGLSGCKKDEPETVPQTPGSADTSDAAEITEPAVVKEASKPDQTPEESMKGLGDHMSDDMAEKLVEMLAQAEKNAYTQITCPVMGGAIDKDIFVEYKGKKVYFCCPPCKEKFNADPESFLSKLPQFKK